MNPKCPKCGASDFSSKVLDVPKPNDDEESGTKVGFVFCTPCGTTVGTWNEDVWEVVLEMFEDFGFLDNPVGTSPDNEERMTAGKAIRQLLRATSKS